MDDSLIPSALRRARTSRGLTLDSMSSRCGLSAQHISKIETGRGRRTHLHSIEQLAGGLNLTLMLIPDYLAAEVRAFLQSRGRSFNPPALSQGDEPI